MANVQPSVLPPPRLERFSDPTAAVVWAAIEKLDDAQKHEILDALAAILADADSGPVRQRQRQRRAITALRDAARLLSHSPSIQEYQRLRAGHDDWPPEASVRRWLGAGSWNDALSAARRDSERRRVADRSARALFQPG